MKKYVLTYVVNEIVLLSAFFNALCLPFYFTSFHLYFCSFIMQEVSDPVMNNSQENGRSFLQNENKRTTASAVIETQQPRRQNSSRRVSYSINPATAGQPPAASENNGLLRKFSQESSGNQFTNPSSRQSVVDMKGEWPDYSVIMKCKCMLQYCQVLHQVRLVTRLVKSKKLVGQKSCLLLFCETCHIMSTHDKRGG